MEKQDDPVRSARLRERELRSFITKREALALVMNVMARHERDRHGAAQGWWRKLWRKAGE